MKVKARFVPSLRFALDGKAWYCVYDTQEKKYSSFLCHTKYKTKKACQRAIDYYNSIDDYKRSFSK